MVKNCSNCTYTEPYYPPLDSFMKEYNFTCHRYPPTQKPGFFPAQPLVKYFDWCGEWKAREV